MKKTRSVYLDEQCLAIITETMKDKHIKFNTAIRYLLKRVNYLENEMFYMAKELQVKKNILKENTARGSRVIK
jgi:hypothetical protein